MLNKSIWENNHKTNNIKFQTEIPTKTDILIIGGGITGITTAYLLKNSNLSVTIIDKSKIGMGITSNSTAKVSYLQETIYQDLEKAFSRRVAKLYFDSQLEAIKIINNIIKKEMINCDFEKVDSILFTTNKNNIRKLEKEKEILESFDVKCRDIDKFPIDFPIYKGFIVDDTYQMNPIKYTRNLAKMIKNDISIIENIKALNIKLDNGKYIIKTDKGNIISKYVIVACHYPFFTLPGLIPIKNHIEREYVNASKYHTPKHFTAINVDSNLHSIRFYKDYLIYGSTNQLLTNKIDYEKEYQKSKREFKKYFNIEPEYTWTNQDLITGDYLPFIGNPDKNQPNLFIATGYNAWGMTNSIVASKLISDLIQNNNNLYIDLFSPLRKNLSLFGNAILNSIYYTKVYLQTYLTRNHSFYPNSVKVTKINGEYYGIYIDKDSIKHIVKNKCPHLKCNLVFNNEEKTWDCPCHGSRFTIDGNVLEGPTTYSIRINNNETL